MTAATLAVFVGVALLAYVTPGPDWFLVLRRAAQGRRVGLVTALGVQAGLLVHMIVASVGVAAVLLSSAALFTLLKLVGAAYLAYLGIAALVDARRADARRSDSAAEPTPPPLLVVFRQALLANVLNPKAALFFVAVLPQFLSPTAPVAPQVLLSGRSTSCSGWPGGGSSSGQSPASRGCCPARAAGWSSAASPGWR